MRRARSTVSTARSTPAQYPRGHARRIRFGTTPSYRRTHRPKPVDMKSPCARAGSMEAATLTEDRAAGPRQPKHGGPDLLQAPDDLVGTVGGPHAHDSGSVAGRAHGRHRAIPNRFVP